MMKASGTLIYHAIRSNPLSESRSSFNGISQHYYSSISSDIGCHMEAYSLQVGKYDIGLLFDPNVFVGFKEFAQSMLPNNFLILVRVEDDLFCPSSCFQLDSDQIVRVFWLQSQLEEYPFVFIYRESPVGDLSPKYLGQNISHLCITVRAHTLHLTWNRIYSPRRMNITLDR